jgi:hypothetical protein
MQLGHDDFRGGNTLPLMNVDRDTATIVPYGAGTVRIESDTHLLGIASESLIDGIIHDFIHHMVQAGPVIGIADIHAGPLAHGVEALENLD